MADNGSGQLLQMAMEILLFFEIQEMDLEQVVQDGHLVVMLQVGLAPIY